MNTAPFSAKMKRVCLILATLAACLLSCSRGGRTIPADKLADIYADMLILDQWARNNAAPARQADTSLVYEPIIRRHGYTVDDYVHTVEAYLRKPGEFANVFEQVRRTLQARADFLTAVEEQKDEARSRRERTDARTDYRKARIFTVTGEPTLAVRIELDSTGLYNLERVLPDTLYEGLFMVLRDSLLRDSLSADSLKRDSLLQDSILADSLAAVPDPVLTPENPPVEPVRIKPVEEHRERPARVIPTKKGLKEENEANIREIPVSAE